MSWNRAREAVIEFSSAADAALTAAAREDVNATTALLARCQVRLDLARSRVSEYIMTNADEAERDGR